MKVYLLYDTTDVQNMPMLDIHEAIQGFIDRATKGQGALFFHGLFAKTEEDNHVYRAGVIFDSFDELMSMPTTDIPPGYGAVGSCIDLTKVPQDNIDRSMFRHSSQNG